MAILLKNNSYLFVFLVLLIVMTYEFAIPNILASALTKYIDCFGTADALLGLIYYILLGVGLVFAGMSQQLGLVLIGSSMAALFLAFIAQRFSVFKQRVV